MKWKKGILSVLVPILVFVISSYVTIDVLLKAGGTVVCPDVRGQKIEDAKRIVEGKGLSLSVARYEPRNDVPYGYITVQKPEANITIRKGRVVNVLVSEGPQLLDLPSVVDEPLEGAEATLRQKQMEIEKIVRVPSKKPGKVIAQIPKAGTKLLEGSSIVLYVGKTPEVYFLLPDIKTADISSLSEELDRKKIKYRISYGVEDPATPAPGPKVPATPSRTIFRSEDNILINVNGG